MGTPKFVGAWVDAHKLPRKTLPQFAFIGRSNVGKSSIINFLTGFGKLARTSNTPGRTRTINLFDWDNMCLVDLPGYGFAKASKTDAAAWGKLVGDYLDNANNLRKIFLLIDARRGIMKSDSEVMDIFNNSGTAFQIILTKIDKIGKAELKSLIEKIGTEIKSHPAAIPDVIPTSSVKKIGLDEFKAAIEL